MSDELIKALREVFGDSLIVVDEHTVFPSEKAPEMEEANKGMFGFDRREYIIRGKCIPKPYGCGGEAVEFTDDLSRKEYSVSGMCQKCQDGFFGTSDED